ncbi:MAG: hypothetical protein AB3N28_14975 [Kordiimonas sp.]
MTNSQIFKNSLLAAVAAVALVACGDDSTELASPGTSGPNPGTGNPTPAPAPEPEPEPQPTVKVGRGGIEYSSAGNCPTGTSAVTVGTHTHCSLSGTITEDVTLTADNIYQLSGKVAVGIDTGADGTAADGDAAKLTIEAGTVLYGATASDVLVVSRGSEIDATGNAANPIVFTSALDLDLSSELGLTPAASYSGPALSEPFTSEWGGLVINGAASINTCNGSGCEADGEGDSGLYGGTDDADSSGVMKYVQVKYAGNPITADDELNGIAFQGVGSGTELDYIHVHNGADDGVEFFGGTAQIKHLVITGADDDSLDWTQGWRGKAQHVIIMQNPAQPASDQGIEADNFGDGNDFLPRAQPMLSNLTIVGSASQGGESDIGILLREGTGANIWNAVVSDFGDACLDIDQDATFANAGSSATNLSGNLTIESTLLGSNCKSTFKDDGNNFDLAAYFNGQPNNAVGATTLSNGFINGSAEAAVTATNVSTKDSFFDSVDYIGAVKSSAAADNWTTGWSYGLNAAPSCPEGTTASSDGNTCTLSGTYTSDVRLVSGLDYVLSGKVVIGTDLGSDPAAPLATGDAATLTIEPGVTVMGENQTSYLVVSRGSKLNSNGTADAPVTFTAINPDTRNLDTDTSLWGGLVINGRATINTCNGSGVCEAEGEGDSGLYGGVDDTDDSGQIFYTRVVYAGNPITADDELNGIAFQGVGSGTEIDYLQVHNGADDGVEFFGGTATAKHLVITGADDDSLDWTQGWRGKVQHLLIVQNPNQPASDQGIEADNFGDGNDFLPRAHPMIANATIIGGGTAGGESDIGILLREGTAANLWNVVVADFGDACLDIDQDATFAVSGADATTLTGDLTLQSTLLTNSCASIFKDDGNNFDLATWFNGQANNTVGDDTLSTQSGAASFKTYINGSSENGVTATDVSAIDSFFDATTHIGAVRNAASDWVAGWTVWLNQ